MYSGGKVRRMRRLGRFASAAAQAETRLPQAVGSSCGSAYQSRARRFSHVGAMLVGLVLALLIAVPAARADTPDPGLGAPTVWSDKADYGPGEQVTLNGANWTAGETVHIRVNDDTGSSWDRDVDVTADETGGIVDRFNLPSW